MFEVANIVDEVGGQFALETSRQVSVVLTGVNHRRLDPYAGVDAQELEYTPESRVVIAAQLLGAEHQDLLPRHHGEQTTQLPGVEAAVEVGEDAALCGSWGRHLACLKFGRQDACPTTLDRLVEGKRLCPVQAEHVPVGV